MIMTNSHVSTEIYLGHNRFVAEIWSTVSPNIGPSVTCKSVLMATAEGVSLVKAPLFFDY